ncbi:SDR family oxidoreductase [Deinococcus aquiradiocola]|uniref:Short-chain dehydrogenase/reductas n=1 Tax=Deinococcus aquiradiocola TaxID=393059 RepID=A0A917UQX1_9DEIO|nr:SDR family oxidoreductase [Deinococcus aquiradiocola]GGJ77742.1 short-chain dehydrogenase/reductas [Deinococcus aquiradiocola]
MGKDVIVVIGAGAIGIAIGRRQGTGKHVLLADYNEQNLERAKAALEDAGHEVSTHPVDVSEGDSVNALADHAATLGPVVQVIQTAGLSPAQATPQALLAVDLYGTAIVLDEFARVIAPGGAGLVVSSMAGHMFPMLLEEQQALLSTQTRDLLALPFITAIQNSTQAYCVAKKANQLHVQRAAATTWGDRGARVNAISPGIVLTPLARDELNSAAGDGYRAMVRTSASKRMGTVDEIAAAANFMLGQDAAFMTGADLLIDGGVIPAMRTGRLPLPGV